MISPTTHPSVSKQCFKYNKVTGQKKGTATNPLKTPRQSGKDSSENSKETISSGKSLALESGQEEGEDEQEEDFVPGTDTPMGSSEEKAL